MKRFSPLAWVIATPASFVFLLLLSSFGPLSTGASFTRNVMTSLAPALFCGTFISWNSQRADERQQQAITLDPVTLSRVDALLSDHKKAAAVEAVRAATGADSQTAANTVEVRRTQTSRLRYLGL